MNVYFCENNEKGNQYVGADNIGNAVRVFVRHMNVEPNKITTMGQILLNVDLELKFKVVDK